MGEPRGGVGRRGGGGRVSGAPEQQGAARIPVCVDVRQPLAAAAPDAASTQCPAEPGRLSHWWGQGGHVLPTGPGTAGPGSLMGALWAQGRKPGHQRRPWAAPLSKGHLPVQPQPPPPPGRRPPDPEPSSGVQRGDASRAPGSGRNEALRASGARARSPAGPRHEAPTTHRPRGRAVLLLSVPFLASPPGGPFLHPSAPPPSPVAPLAPEESTWEPGAEKGSDRVLWPTSRRSKASCLSWGLGGAVRVQGPRMGRGGVGGGGPVQRVRV